MTYFNKVCYVMHADGNALVSVLQSKRPMTGQTDWLHISPWRVVWLGYLPAYIVWTYPLFHHIHTRNRTPSFYYLVVPLFFLSLCYSDLQLSDLTFTSGKVYLFPCMFTFGWRYTLGFCLAPLLLFKPLSSALHGSIRFLRNLLPASHSAYLTVGLPAVRVAGEMRAYQVSHK